MSLNYQKKPIYKSATSLLIHLWSVTLQIKKHQKNSKCFQILKKKSIFCNRNYRSPDHFQPKKRYRQVQKLPNFPRTLFCIKIN